MNKLSFYPLLLLLALAGWLTLALSPAETDPSLVAPSIQFSPPISPPPDIRLSRKRVDPSIATVGDVLTYTIIIVNTGGPTQQHSVMIDYLSPEVAWLGQLSHTGTFSQFYYSPAYHGIGWNAALPAGPAVVTLTWQVEITAAPVGGFLTNTAYIYADQRLVTPQAAVLIQTPTATSSGVPTPIDPPILTVTSIPTATLTSSTPSSPTPTDLPSSRATATPTNNPTVVPTTTSAPIAPTTRSRSSLRPTTTTPYPTVTPVPGVTVRPTLIPPYLPETGGKKTPTLKAGHTLADAFAKTRMQGCAGAKVDF